MMILDSRLLFWATLYITYKLIVMFQNCTSCVKLLKFL